MADTGSDSPSKGETTSRHVARADSASALSFDDALLNRSNLGRQGGRCADADRCADMQTEWITPLELPDANQRLMFRLWEEGSWGPAATQRRRPRAAS